jgi:hypothetical protein
VLQALLERGLILGWLPISAPVMFLYVFVPASLPALVVGAADGVARSLRRTRWIAPLRIVALLLIIMLGPSTALIGAFFLAFVESNLNADTVPLPLGTYLGALAGMEAVRAASWGTALLTGRILRGRRTGEQGH